LVKSYRARVTRRVALVTGANHGIGAAIAVALARSHTDVAVSFLRLPLAHDDAGRPPEYRRLRSRDGTDTVTRIEAEGARAIAIEADLAELSTPRYLFDEVEETLGPVSILINNASYWRKDTFVPDRGDRFDRDTEIVSAATFTAQFDVDARAGALLIAELASRHRARGAAWGRIVSLTSGGPAGFPGEVSYGAAKAALENYTMSASVELADDGITANVVYPPVTDTGWVTDQVRDFVARSSDHVHIAEPEDVAAIVAWLCSDDAGLVTGNVIRLR
jgi:3-oxoacyl-[acyl-carrier protein] reductase